MAYFQFLVIFASRGVSEHFWWFAKQWRVTGSNQLFPIRFRQGIVLFTRTYLPILKPQIRVEEDTFASIEKHFYERPNISKSKHVVRRRYSKKKKRCCFERSLRSLSFTFFLFSFDIQETLSSCCIQLYSSSVCLWWLTVTLSLSMICNQVLPSISLTHIVGFHPL